MNTRMHWSGRFAWSLAVSLIVSIPVWISCLIQFGTVFEVPLNFDHLNHQTLDRLWDPAFLAPLLFAFGSFWRSHYFEATHRRIGILDWLAMLGILISGMAALVVVFVGWSVIWWQSYLALAAICLAILGVRVLCMLGSLFRLAFMGRSDHHP